jgi:hypothetical protein
MTQTNLSVWASCIALLGCASAPQYRIAVAPSLRPVDPSRAMVVFSQIRGEACGRDAVVGALRQMKRLRPIDGYLELVVEDAGSGDERCARATAYPFRYGTDASLPELRVGPASTDPELVPGASATLPPDTAPAFDCKAACARASQSITGSIARALAEDRCQQRCGLPDIAFQACIAQVADAAARCLTP